MKIESVEALVLRGQVDPTIADSTQDAALIRVRTDDGLVGYGESDASPEVVKAIVDGVPSHILSAGLREILLGEDPLRIWYQWDRMYRGSIFYGRRGVALMAISGIDIALYDLVGKALGVPAHQLLGGARHTSVPAYASALMPDEPRSAAALSESLVEQGFSAIKLGWGPLGRDLDLDVELVKAVRNAVGENVDILLDVGFGWGDSATAIRQVNRLAEFDLYLVEEPLPPDDLIGYARLRNSSPIPIAFGEENTTRHEFAEVFRLGAADIVQPDVTRCGGLTEAFRIAELASHYGINVIPHAWSTGIVQAATMHLNAVLERPKFLEYSVQPSPLNRELVSQGVVIEDGIAHVPTGPGLGIEIDETAIERMRIS